MSNKTAQLDEKAAAKARFGARMREVRGPRPLESQAEKMGLSRQRLAEWEKGDVPEYVMVFARLAQDEGVDLNWLFAGDNGR